MKIDRRWVFVLEAIVCIAGAVMLVQALTKAGRVNGYDFTARLEQTRAFFDGVDPYGVADEAFPLTYSLFTCILLAPFAFLPYVWANVFWFLTNAACLVVAARQAVQSWSPESKLLELRAIVALGILFMLGVVQNNFVNGQTNFLLLALCVLSLTSLNAGYPVSSGFFWAAGIAVKVTPLVLVLYFLFRRAWKTLIWGAVGTFVFALGLPWLFQGNAVFEYYRGYVQDYLLPQIAKGSADVSLSRSFTFARYLLQALPSLHGRLPGFLSAGIVFAPLVLLQLRSNKKSQRQEALIFFAYLAAILWITPISETHHLAYLAPAVLVAIVQVVRATPATTAMKGLLLAGLFVLMVAGKWTFTAYFLAIGVCYGLLYVLAMSTDPERAGNSAPTSRRAT